MMKRIEMRLIAAFCAGLIILLAPVAVGAVEPESTPTMGQLTAIIFMLFIFVFETRIFFWYRLEKEEESDEDNH